MTSEDSLEWMLKAQRELQVESFGSDPCLLEGEARVHFLDWNLTALADELHEARGEIGWKPWATSRHVNVEPAVGEMVDGWHFFMNILLCLHGPEVLAHGETWLAERFRGRYFNKRKTNAERQEEGYDGVAGKCPQCGRDRIETQLEAVGPTAVLLYCRCGYVYETIQKP